MSIDICTWQADLANNAGPSIQVEMTTARTVAEARKEFDALVAAIVKNTAPGGHSGSRTRNRRRGADRR